MKLFKESRGFWAARKRLDNETDVDITVQECGSCGRSITTVTFCRAYCQEGIIPDWSHDHQEVLQWRQDTYMGSDRIDKGEAKLFGWSGKPTELQISGIKDKIKLEYEQ